MPLEPPRDPATRRSAPRRRPRRPARFFLTLLVAALGAAPAASEAWQPGPPVDPDAAGAGLLLWKGPAGTVPLPILETTVEIDVTGPLVRGTVTQRFHNPTEEVIEALYVFPLPDRATVRHMEMRIGPRRITAVVQEREEARRTYEVARDEGRKAAIVEQERPNLFTTAAANVNPGERVEVVLEYLEEAAWEDGAFALRFPMTFTPRYESPGAPPEPGVRGCFVPAGHAAAPRVGLVARVDAGMPLAEVVSRSHDVETFLDGNTWEVRPVGSPVEADRDFLLEWRPVVRDRPGPALFVEDREDGRYALMMLVPPAPDPAGDWGLATETMFVIDVSGSMAGASIEQAREALLSALGRLRPGDTFNILRFNDGTARFSDRFEPADPETLERAARWVRGLRAGGGTEILGALIEALGRSGGDPAGRVRRLVFLTDGAVADEERVFRAIVERLGDARLHAIGIGHAPNAHLMRKMAAFGRGVAEFIAAESEAANRIDAFFSRIDRPVLSGLALRWSGAVPREIWPERLPDLYPGEPLLVSFRLDPGERVDGVTLLGRHRDGEVRHDFAFEANAAPDSGIATRWAGRKVDALMDLLHEGADEATVRDAVVEVGLRFALVTRYTSLVAVEEFTSASDPARTVDVAGALPAGSRLGGAPALPRGGTTEPLRALLGLLLTAVGFGILRRTASGRVGP